MGRVASRGVVPTPSDGVEGGHGMAAKNRKE